MKKFLFVFLVAAAAASAGPVPVDTNGCAGRGASPEVKSIAGQITQSSGAPSREQLGAETCKTFAKYHIARYVADGNSVKYTICCTERLPLSDAEKTRIRADYDARIAAIKKMQTELLDAADKKAMDAAAEKSARKRFADHWDAIREASSLCDNDLDGLLIEFEGNYNIPTYDEHKEIRSSIFRNCFFDDERLHRIEAALRKDICEEGGDAVLRGDVCECNGANKKWGGPFDGCVGKTCYNTSGNDHSAACRAMGADAAFADGTDGRYCKCKDENKIFDCAINDCRAKTDCEKRHKVQMHGRPVDNELYGPICNGEGGLRNSNADDIAGSTASVVAASTARGGKQSALAFTPVPESVAKRPPRPVPCDGGNVVDGKCECEPPKKWNFWRTKCKEPKPTTIEGRIAPDIPEPMPLSEATTHEDREFIDQFNTLTREFNDKIKELQRNGASPG